MKTGYKESDDPTYQEIENGNWYFNETYGTIHRIASAGVRLLGPHRIGHIITKGETLEDAQKLLFEAMDKVEITVE